MQNKYQVIVEGVRTVKVDVIANDYDHAQRRAIEIALEYFPETRRKEWEIIETITVKKRRGYR